MKIINCFVIILGISETLALKVALIRGTNDWETLMGGGRPCPVAFDPDDVRETMKLDAEQGEADEIREALQDLIGYGRRAGCPPHISFP